MRQKLQGSGYRISDFKPLLFAIPALLTFLVFEVAAAVAITAVTLVAIFALLVYIPEDKRLERARVEIAAEGNEVIDKVFTLLPEIRDAEVRSELNKACNIAKSLLFDFATGSISRSYIKDKFFVLLRNMHIQVQRWLLHEAGEQPLGKNEEKVRSILIYYDSLFLFYKHGDVESPEFQQSLSSTEAEMLIQMLKLMMSGKGIK